MVLYYYWSAGVVIVSPELMRKIKGLKKMGLDQREREMGN
jgi:hypothetical protein